MSQANAGKLQIHNEPFLINDFLNEMESMLKVKAEEKGVQLSFQVPDNYPNVIIGDKTRLFQILLNLLNNAIKFTPQGYINLSTQVLNQNDSAVRLRFTIKDTGIGIKKEKLSMLFKSFSRVHDKGKEVIEGAGLGLNIVKRLLQLLNGEINVESEFSKGTTFTVDVPFLLNGIETDSIPKEDITSSIPVEWKSKRFLMIEDNKANILYSKEIFEDWGLKLCIVNSLEEATEKLKEKYDCILSDVKLPDGNGLDFISELRNKKASLNQNTPSIILTASSNEDGVLQFDKEIIQGYLSKPFPPDQLLNELRNIIQIKNPELNYQPKETPTSLELEDDVTTYSSVDFINAISIRFKKRRGLMLEMVKIFLDQSPEMLRILESEPTNFEQLRFEAHKFKSTVNIVGLFELKNYASKTEQLMMEGNHSDETMMLIQDFIKQLKLDDKIVRVAYEEMKIASN